MRNASDESPACSATAEEIPHVFRNRARAERNSLRETTGKYTDKSNFESTRSYTLFLLKLETDVSINYYKHAFVL